ncbi:MAG: DUF3175 domain-containing protein [Hyphomicrobium sp.]
MATTKGRAKTKPRAKSKATTSSRRKSARAASSARHPAQKWSQSVTEHSDAMTLQRDVFTLDDPKMIAASLKRSAERSRRRKSEPYRSAMSILTFYVNRAGSKLTTERKRILQRAKDELRKAFGKES